MGTQRKLKLMPVVGKELSFLRSRSTRQLNRSTACGLRVEKSSSASCLLREPSRFSHNVVSLLKIRIKSVYRVRLPQEKTILQEVLTQLGVRDFQSRARPSPPHRSVSVEPGPTDRSLGVGPDRTRRERSSRDTKPNIPANCLHSLYFDALICCVMGSSQRDAAEEHDLPI